MMGRRSTSAPWGILLLVLLPFSYEKFIEKEESPGLLWRMERSVKDAYPKDDKRSERSRINALNNKIDELEEALENDKETLEIVLHQREAMLEKIEDRIAEIRTTLQGHGQQLGNISDLGSSKDYFVISNKTCGGVLSGKTGYIVYGDESSYLRHTGFQPTCCVWTINANNREHIKVVTHSITRSSRGNETGSQAYALEITAKDPNSTKSPLILVPRRLLPHRQYMFSGPVVFLVYSTDGHGVGKFDFDAQFEGIGRKVKTTTHFSHHQLKVYDIPHRMNDSDLKSLENARFTSDAPYIRDFTTLTISNYSTRLLLRMSFDKGQCREDEEFLFARVNDEAEDGVMLTDCCVTDCQKGVTVLPGNPGVFIVSKRFQRPMPFAITWDTELPYPSHSSHLTHSSSEGLGSNCGEILGGMSGEIRYNSDSRYRNNERCIWVIVPQPSPRTTIKIKVMQEGVEESHYDKLYMVQLTDSEGRRLPNAPKITSLQKYAWTEEAIFAASREVFIVFYSDSYVTGTGFVIQYEVVGKRVTTGATNYFSLVQQSHGSASVTLELDHETYHVYAFSIRSSLAYDHLLKLHLNATSKGRGGSGCLLANSVTVYTTVVGFLMNATALSCDSNPDTIVVEALDNLALVVINNTMGTYDATYHLSWEQVNPDGDSLPPTTNPNKCGGVIEGDKGIIEYKPETNYAALERCVWVIHSPGRSRIDLKLVREGFEECCDYILVSTLEKEADVGLSTVTLKRESPKAIMNASLAVVLFQSDSSSEGNGFVLRFDSSGTSSVEEPTYRIIHRDEGVGSFDYRNEGNSNQSDVLVLAYNYHPMGVYSNSDDELSLVGSFSSGDFAQGLDDASGGCVTDTLSLYTLDMGNKTWEAGSVLPKVSSTVADDESGNCSGSVSISKQEPSWFNTAQNSFLVVYRSLQRSEGSFAFSWKRASSCGGVLTGTSGEISYKDGRSYTSGEKCLWLIHVPNAQKIQINLVRNGFERCCDYLIAVQAPTAETLDQWGNITKMGTGDNMVTTAVLDGPVVAVLFHTDDSVDGRGFRATYSKVATSTSSSSTYHRYRLDLDERQQGSYALEMDSNEVAVVGHVAPLRTQWRETRRTESIVLSVFRPYVSTTCASDYFRLAEFEKDSSGRWAIRVKHRFSAIDLNAYGTYRTIGGSSGKCRPTSETELSACYAIEDCRERPSSNTMGTSIYSNVGVWLAVYVAVGEEDGNATAMAMRGFKLDFHA